MQKLVTSEQIRKLESDFIKKHGSDTSLKLMEKAGSGLASVLKEYDEPYLFICGKGNNAGDGFVAARYLYSLGKKVTVCLTSDELSFSPDAKTNFDAIKNTVHCTLITNESLHHLLNNANTLVECLIGTGINKKLNSAFEQLIKIINSSGKKVVACDIPIGIDPDTGNVQDIAIKADSTVTFGYPKIGLFVYPAKKYVGVLKTIDIGLPDIDTNLFLLDDLFLKNNLPKRNEDSNKGTFGKTLLVCGSKKYPGAALLASKAASSIGSGLTALSSPGEVFSQTTNAIPEVTHVEFSLDKILEESVNSSAMVIGPGLTNSGEIKTLVKNLLLKANIPIVLDADGINVLAGKKEIIKNANSKLILTPHPKEFAGFLCIDKEEVLKNKIDITQKVACELGCTIVLKGPASIIASSDGSVYISPFANAALAKGGTGDVLAGFIGGLIAQGLEPQQAACIGVYIHGKSGELVAQDKTVFSLLPQDLITYLPKVMKMYV